MASTPSGNGCWEVDQFGDVVTYGDAACMGSLTGSTLDPPEVGTAATPSGRGDWLLAADGGTFTFGNSHLYGSAASVSSSPPVVSMTVRVHRSADRPMSIGAPARLAPLRCRRPGQGG